VKEEREMDLEVLQLDFVGWSNPRLPVLLYRRVLGKAGADTMATEFEVVFGRNGWPPQWRNGVYSFHHYHSNAHEVLGLAGGSARLVFGGPQGKDVSVAAGDAVLLPAGTGHFQVRADPGFLVVGAYPPDQQHFDICKEPATPDITSRITSVGFPATDPVSGPAGALARLWGSWPPP
jgi:uncharacterized protein YjlB